MDFISEWELSYDLLSRYDIWPSFRKASVSAGRSLGRNGCKSTAEAAARKAFKMWWNGKWEKSYKKSEKCHRDNYALRSFLYDYDLPFGMKNAYWDAHACGRVFRLSAVYHWQTNLHSDMTNSGQTAIFLVPVNDSVQRYVLRSRMNMNIISEWARKILSVPSSARHTIADCPVLVNNRGLRLWLRQIVDKSVPVGWMQDKQRKEPPCCRLPVIFFLIW